jgi:hypothetical protein
MFCKKRSGNAVVASGASGETGCVILRQIKLSQENDFGVKLFQFISVSGEDEARAMRPSVDTVPVVAVARGR